MNKQIIRGKIKNEMKNKIRNKIKSKIKGEQKNKIKDKIICVSVFFIFVFFLAQHYYDVSYSLAASAPEVFMNGYFRYTVEDYSVTILSYLGSEEQVNVPNMIAGNQSDCRGKNS